MHDRGRYFAGPRVLALGTRVPGLPISVHDRLQYGRERRHANARGYHHGVLGSEYMTGRRAVRADHVDLEKKLFEKNTSSPVKRKVLGK